PPRRRAADAAGGAAPGGDPPHGAAAGPLRAPNSLAGGALRRRQPRRRRRLPDDQPAQARMSGTDPMTAEDQQLRTLEPGGGSAEPAVGAPGQRPLSELPPDALIIVPTRNLVLFPGMVFPITIGRQRSIAAVQQAVREERQIGVVMQREADREDPGPLDLHRVGTVANIVRYVTGQDGAHHVVCQGEQRFRVVEFLGGWPFLVARVIRIEEPQATQPELEARFLALQRQALEALELLPQAPQELVQGFRSITSASQLADLAAAYMDLKPDERQEILETIDLTARIDKVSRLLAHRIEVLRLTNEIGQQTKASIDERQREMLLRE